MEGFRVVSLNRVNMVTIVQDTRPVEEYQVSHIPNAIQVDPEADCDLNSTGIKPGATGKVWNNISCLGIEL